MTSLPLLLILVLFITNLKPCETTTTRPFICGAGVCNLNTDGDQYCSSGTDPRCVLCRDVGYACFKPNMPYNCTNYCLGLHDQEIDRKLRGEPCKPLPNITNGFYNAPAVAIQGDTAFFGCKTGYHLNGNGTIICLQFGYWSNDTPKCLKDSSLSTLDIILICGICVLLAGALFCTVIAIWRIRKSSNKDESHDKDSNLKTSVEETGNERCRRDDDNELNILQAEEYQGQPMEMEEIEVETDENEADRAIQYNSFNSSHF